MKSLPVLAAIALVLAGLVGWELLPARPDRSDNAPPRPAPVLVQHAASTTASLLADIANSLLARPLFSPDRRLSAPASGPMAAVEDMPRLTGIIISPTGGRAIFEDPSGHPRIVIQGDRLGRFRIDTITPGEVALIAPDGTHVVRPRFAGAAETKSVSIAAVGGRPR